MYRRGNKTEWIWSRTGCGEGEKGRANPSAGAAILGFPGRAERIGAYIRRRLERDRRRIVAAKFIPLIQPLTRARARLEGLFLPTPFSPGRRNRLYDITLPARKPGTSGLCASSSSPSPRCIPPRLAASVPARPFFLPPFRALFRPSSSRPFFPLLFMKTAQLRRDIVNGKNGFRKRFRKCRDAYTCQTKRQGLASVEPLLRRSVLFLRATEGGCVRDVSLFFSAYNAQAHDLPRICENFIIAAVIIDRIKW